MSDTEWSRALADVDRHRVLILDQLASRRLPDDLDDAERVELANGDLCLVAE